MRREIAYLPEVSQDFVDAFNYYEALAEGLGRKFETAYAVVEKEIETGLLTHRQTFEHFHRVVMRKFPYVVYYRLDRGKAIIAGIFFAKHDPEAIRQALKNRKK